MGSYFINSSRFELSLKLVCLIFSEFQYTMLMELKKLQENQERLFLMLDDHAAVDKTSELPVLEQIATIEDFDSLEQDLHESKEKRAEKVIIIFIYLYKCFVINCILVVSVIKMCTRFFYKIS